jgi:hypothetical protein
MERTRSGVQVAALVLCVLLSSSALVGRPADAASFVRACKGAFDNRHLGYSHQPDRYPEYRYEGVSAYLTPRASGLCTGVGGIGNFSGASIMIAEIGSGGSYWAQVGYERNALYSGYRWFSQFRSDAGAETWYSPGSQTDQLGVRHTFRVLWTKTCACFQASIDGIVVGRSSFNPFVDWPTDLPWAPQFFAETGWLESDVPGSPSNRLPFNSLGAQRYLDDVVEPMPCTMYSFNDNPARWGQASTNCQNFALWTTVQ